MESTVISSLSQRALAHKCNSRSVSPSRSANPKRYCPFPSLLSSSGGILSTPSSGSVRCTTHTAHHADARGTHATPTLPLKPLPSRPRCPFCRSSPLFCPFLLSVISILLYLVLLLCVDLDCSCILAYCIPSLAIQRSDFDINTGGPRHLPVILAITLFSKVIKSTNHCLCGLAFSSSSVVASVIALVDHLDHFLLDLDADQGTLDIFVPAVSPLALSALLASLPPLSTRLLACCFASVPSAGLSFV